MTEYHYVIVEQSGLSQTQHDYWATCALPRLPLMQQEAFAHLQHEGPWLVSLEEDAQAQLESLQAALGQGVIMGSLTSYVRAEELCQHLGRALVAQVQNGQTVLLRSYSPQVMLLLHERSDCPWQSSLFGPINDWTVEIEGQLQHVQGGRLATVPEYQPIVLDTALLQRLAVDPQALGLLEELESCAPHVFTSACHGERLEQVSRALDRARHSGLQHPDDQLLFATLSLMERTPLDEAANWQQVLDGVTVTGLALSESLEISMDDDLT